MIGVRKNVADLEKKYARILGPPIRPVVLKPIMDEQFTFRKMLNMIKVKNLVRFYGVISKGTKICPFLLHFLGPYGHVIQSRVRNMYQMER